jgi:hypothetical protein
MQKISPELLGRKEDRCGLVSFYYSSKSSSCSAPYVRGKYFNRHQIKLKICGPFPRESAEKKAYADIRRKSQQIDKSSFGRLAYLPKAEPFAPFLLRES